MNVEELNEYSDEEKWTWLIDNQNIVEMIDDDDIYFLIKEDNDEEFELHFNESLEISEELATLLKAIGFTSQNY